MNSFVIGFFVWVDPSGGRVFPRANLVHWEFANISVVEVRSLLDKVSKAGSTAFCITIDLAHDPGPKVVNFYGHISESYCNDRFEFGSEVDRARDKVIGAVIRKMVTDKVAGGIE